jgi:hypothetical protein
MNLKKLLVMLQKIKDNFQYILLVFLVLLLFKQCGINREISKIRKEEKSSNELIVNKLDSINTLTKDEMRGEMRKVMFEFLIYEDDFDKKKTSLSEIKSRIETGEK